MSINVDWEALTGGPDGDKLAETIRDFINERFQKVALPKFIHSVKAHSFEFGNIPPDLELKDVCDPLDDFYDTDDENNEGLIADHGKGGLSPSANEHLSHAGIPSAGPHLRFGRNDQPSISVDSPSHYPASLTDNGSVASTYGHELTSESLKHLDDAHTARQPTARSEMNHSRHGGTMGPPPIPKPRLQTNELSRPSIARWSPIDLPANSPFLSRSSTPGIPGGTSNLNYFHLPLSAGLPGSASNAFTSMGGGSRLANTLLEHRHHPHTMYHPPGLDPTGGSRYAEPSHGTGPEPTAAFDLPSRPLTPTREKSVNDVQIVARVRYSGNVRLILTADILLDYPMPSFVGIPLKLIVTGMTFDGVAIIAYIKKKAHFCFLSPDDAEALVGGDLGSFGSPGETEAEHEHAHHTSEHGQESPSGRRQTSSQHVGGLFEEIRVESEIGQKEPGKQVLKNVGKVERFILDQVRKIFENEFVYPSFWTFLV